MMLHTSWIQALHIPYAPITLESNLYNKEWGPYADTDTTFIVLQDEMRLLKVDWLPTAKLWEDEYK